MGFQTKTPARGGKHRVNHDVLSPNNAWHIPLERDGLTLREALRQMHQSGDWQEDIPLLVQLVENPRFQPPGLSLFHGAVDLYAHDCIHLILGRGMMPKDEAFVIGFTMGSTNRVSTMEEKLYTFIAGNIYPGSYRFSEDDVQIFRDGLHLGMLSRCQPLDTIDWHSLERQTLRTARQHINLEVGLLLAYYAEEKTRYPDAVESQRLRER